MLSNFIKEIVHTDPVPYFSQSVLLMYGTNYLFKLILDHYRYSCVVGCIDLSSYFHIHVFQKIGPPNSWR